MITLLAKGIQLLYSVTSYVSSHWRNPQVQHRQQNKVLPAKKAVTVAQSNNRIIILMGKQKKLGRKNAPISARPSSVSTFLSWYKRKMINEN
jgi:hypothetical protein